MSKPSVRAHILMIFLAAFMPTIANARIKLITLPTRERVEIQLDNPDATLVEEERMIPLVKGENQVDFRGRTRRSIAKALSSACWRHCPSTKAAQPRWT